MKLPLEFERAAGKLSALPTAHHPEIALLGRSNVGKSSLLNCVAGRKNLARTSNTPGRTQALNFYKSANFWIVDLPGYGYAKVPESMRRSWKKLMEGYLGRRQTLVAGVLIVDIRREPNELDLVMQSYLVQRELPYLTVVTKADKLKRGQVAKSVSEIRKVLKPEDEEVVVFSAKTGEGKDAVGRWILAQGKQ